MAWPGLAQAAETVSATDIRTVVHIPSILPVIRPPAHPLTPHTHRHYQEHEADATCALLILKYALGDAGEDFQRLYM
mgnify:CR=1 FL=1